MALNLESLSITSVFNSIVNFFKSQENNTRWTDLTSGAEGTFLIRLLSNVFSALSYRIVAQSRENFISTAKLPSSNTGIAVNLQYSVFRGSNLKRLIQILPTGDYTFPKLSVIGRYSPKYDIITLEDTSLVNGEVKDVKVVVGKLKEETFKPGTSAVKVFSLFTTGISEDYVLYVDSNEVPTTKYMKQMVYDKYLVRTNPYLSVDIIYLNTYPEFKYKYSTDTEITIKYVELADVPVTNFTADMITYGIIQDTKDISQYLPFESVDSIKVKAPLDHELQNLIRSKADYAKRMAEIVPSVEQSDFDPLTPTYTLITYLKNDLTLLTNNERTQVETLLKEENFFGTPLPDITNPRRVVAALSISLALNTKYKNISDIQYDIQNILSNYYDYSLGIEFNTYDFERRVEKLSYVRYARVNYTLNERIPGGSYQIGYILNYEGNYYVASQILGITGDTEPEWNVPMIDVKEIDTGLLTQDGTITWRTFKKLPNMPDNVYFPWSADSQFGIGEYVYSDKYPNYMFKCVDLSKASGSVTPNISLASDKDFIVDSGIVWVVKPHIDAPAWASRTNYSLGDTVNISGNTQHSLECVSYTGVAGTEDTINFELPKYPVLSKTTSTFTVQGDKTFFFKPQEVITVAFPEGYVKMVVDQSAYNDSADTTTITVKQAVDLNKDYQYITTKPIGTRDGQILWKLVDDIDNIKYSWNNYVTFTYDLDIIGGK